MYIYIVTFIAIFSKHEAMIFFLSKFYQTFKKSSQLFTAFQKMKKWKHATIHCIKSAYLWKLNQKKNVTSVWEIAYSGNTEQPRMKEDCRNLAENSSPNCPFSVMAGLWRTTCILLALSSKGFQYISCTCAPCICCNAWITNLLG